jgi:hypothetical protein
MEVAEQRDGEAVQPFRQARQQEFLADDARTVWFEKDRIASNGDGSCDRRETKKFTPGN